MSLLLYRCVPIYEVFYSCVGKLVIHDGITFNSDLRITKRRLIYFSVIHRQIEKNVFRTSEWVLYKAAV